jgi:hypothetical protein
MWRVWGRREAYAGFWWGNLKEIDHLGDPGLVGRIILRWIVWKWDVGVRTGSSWLRVGRDRWQALVNALMNLRVT